MGLMQGWLDNGRLSEVWWSFSRGGSVLRNTDIKLLVCEVDIVIVQQLSLPGGGQESDGGGQGEQEGHPGQQEAVAIQEGVSLRNTHDCAETLMHNSQNN